MPTIQLEIHTSHAKLWENQSWRYAFLMGGRANGRSGTASRYLISQLFSKEYTRGAFMRAIREDIRSSCWSELNDRLTEANAENAKGLVVRDMEMEYGQNSLRAFGFRASSGSLTARLKSLANFNCSWIEEMEEIGEDEFRTFDDSLRTTQGRTRIVGTLNPPAKSHWLIQNFFDLEPAENVHGIDAKGFYIPHLKDKHKHNTLFIPGTYRENLPNLAPETVTRYASYRETNPAYYWQAIEGLVPETVQGRIYSGWQELPSLPHEARLLGYGLDFGFDPDPVALVAVYYYNGGYILDEKLYATRMTNTDLATTIKMLPTAPIIADSAEPKSIEELKQLGVHTIPCTKGADSVQYGIKHVQGLKISYTAHSTNLKKEYENYAWKRTKTSAGAEDHLGIEDPNCANHLMSASRYFLTDTVKANADPEAIARKRIEVKLQDKKRVENVAKRFGL